LPSILKPSALSRLFAAPVFPDVADRRLASILHAILLTNSMLILASLILTPLLAGNKTGSYIVIAWWGATVLICWYCLQNRRLGFASHLLSWTIFAIATVYALITGPLSAGYFIPATTYFAVLLRPRWGVSSACGALLIAIFVVLGGPASIGIPVLFPASPRAQVANFGVQLVMVIVPILLILRSHVLALRRADQELRKRQQTENELRRVNDNLESLVAARTRELVAANQELDRFTHRVAHDLRGPLGQISGFVSLAKLLPSVAGDEKASSHLNWAMVAAQRLMDLVSGLLLTAQLGKAKLELADVDLDALVAEVVTGASSQLSARHVDWQIGPLGSVRADPALIGNVFTNLIQNALKFSADRDPAVISIAPDARNTDGSKLAICIKDNGVGFDMAQADRLFREFERLHAATKFSGSGVGLASCKRIVELHGGEINAHGAPEGGAEFCFWLPRTASTATGGTGTAAIS
jgi:signal transduction histidine kinase